MQVSFEDEEGKLHKVAPSDGGSNFPVEEQATKLVIEIKLSETNKPKSDEKFTLQVLGCFELTSKSHTCLHCVLLYGQFLTFYIYGS